MCELEKVGSEQLSLRELAKMLGVSRAAPYRHFENKDALLRSLAGIGLEQLGKAYVNASSSGISPADRLRLACQAYIDFASNNPELYRLIFSGDLDWPEMFEKESEGDALGKPKESFDFFENLVADAIVSKDVKRIRNVTLILWSLIHGSAKLKMDGMLSAFTSIDEFESVLLNAVTVIGDGVARL